MKKIIFLTYFCIFGFVGCSDNDQNSLQVDKEKLAAYDKKMQEKVDLVKSETNIPTNMGTPEVALCAAASMKIGQGIAIYKVWTGELSARYRKIYSDKSETEIEKYTSERITDKLDSLKEQGYSTPEAFLKFYKLNCKS